MKSEQQVVVLPLYIHNITTQIPVTNGNLHIRADNSRTLTPSSPNNQIAKNSFLAAVPRGTAQPKPTVEAVTTTILA